MQFVLNKIKKSPSKWMVFVDQGLVSGMNFLMTLLLARFLGLEDFGLFALGWMFVLFFSSVQMAFIISPLYTLYPKHENKKQYLATVHAVQVIYSLLVGVTAFVVIQLASVFKPEWVVPGVSYSLPLVAMFFGWQDFYRRLNITLQEQKHTLKSDLIAYGLQPVLLLGLVYFNQLSIHMMFMGLVVLFVTAIALSFKKQELNFNSSMVAQTLLENWQFSKYLVGTSLLQWVSGNFFIIAAGSILTPIAIGVIRIAQNVVGILNVLFAALENIVPLKAAQLLSQSGRKMTLHYFKVILIYGGTATATILTTIALGREYIIEWFYGIQYLEYSNVFLGFTIIYVLVFVNTILGFVIRTFEMNRIFLISYITTSVFSIVAAKPIINQFGVYGVVLGIVGTQLINITVYIISLKSNSIALWK